MLSRRLGEFDIHPSNLESTTDSNNCVPHNYEEIVDNVEKQKLGNTLTAAKAADFYSL